MFCIRPLCGGTAQCGGQMRDKATAVNVGAEAADLQETHPSQVGASAPI
jgi:hypothetical protein